MAEKQSKGVTPEPAKKRSDVQLPYLSSAGTIKNAFDKIRQGGNAG